MSVNLSVKNVPEEIAARLRARAERNRRSLQRELLSILESVTEYRNPPEAPVAPRVRSVEDVAARARLLFPQGTESSASFIRALRDRG